MGGDKGIVFFDIVEVPEPALVGELHQGFSLAMLGVSSGRLYNVGRGVGLARCALTEPSRSPIVLTLVQNALRLPGPQAAARRGPV